MEAICFNSEPDGRLLIVGKGFMLTIHTNAIDSFADALKKYSGAEGDCTPFKINFMTGEVEEI